MHLFNSLKIILIFIAFHNNTSQEIKSSIDNKGKKIAYIKNNEYHFLIDTTKYKTNLKNIAQFLEDVSYDEVSIKKDTVIGDYHNEYYMLMAYDRKHFLKTVRWLIKDKDTLYFHKNTRQNVDNEIFCRTYFSVYGSDTNCYPNVLYIDGEYLWTGDTTGKPYCDPGSPCKSNSTFFPYE